MTSADRFKDMVWVPEGSFLMGSEDYYPEEGPSTGSVSAAFGWTSMP